MPPKYSRTVSAPVTAEVQLANGTSLLTYGRTKSLLGPDFTLVDLPTECTQACESYKRYKLLGMNQVLCHLTSCRGIVICWVLRPKFH